MHARTTKTSVLAGSPACPLRCAAAFLIAQPRESPRSARGLLFCPLFLPCSLNPRLLPFRSLAPSSSPNRPGRHRILSSSLAASDSLLPVLLRLQPSLQTFTSRLSLSSPGGTLRCRPPFSPKHHFRPCEILSSSSLPLSASTTHCHISIRAAWL